MAWWWAASGVLFLVVIPVVAVLGFLVVRRGLVVKRHLDRISQTFEDVVEADGYGELDRTCRQVEALRRVTAEYVDALPSRRIALPRWPGGSE